MRVSQLGSAPDIDSAKQQARFGAISSQVMHGSDQTQRSGHQQQ